MSIETGQLLPAVGASARVRLPPQSPSRYILRRDDAHRPTRPVAPAVSKSLHSRACRQTATTTSGCPRSLQVATFAAVAAVRDTPVRLPPQSPSRYIPGGHRGEALAGPVAPAVSKSLHSLPTRACAPTRSGCPRSLQVATFPGRSAARSRRVRLPPQSPSRYIPPAGDRSERHRPVAPAVSKSLHSPPTSTRPALSSGCPRSLQVATFGFRQVHEHDRVRLPPQSPSRYIRRAGGLRGDVRPVAPAVSKSLHSSGPRAGRHRPSGCPRSLQVATFCAERHQQRIAVRLPPQSPSRYILGTVEGNRNGSPVAPAVSKSLHSSQAAATPAAPSGCPRSLQVATFGFCGGCQGLGVRLPPQSPSRYIRRPGRGTAPWSPVAPAVSKSLHSPGAGTPTVLRSGCPRSLQVATFCPTCGVTPANVRLPPQSPSRYILRYGAHAPYPSPVAPAVSKSLHSTGLAWFRSSRSGCPRSLQVATFGVEALLHAVDVRLPPQSPSRYIHPR